MNKGVPVVYHFDYFMKGWKEKILHDSPIFITFFVASKCNANCGHYFYWQRLNRTKNELALEEIDEISNSIPPFPKLLLSGGEPFLRDNVDEICNLNPRK